MRRHQSLLSSAFAAAALLALAACAKPMPQRGSAEWERRIARGDLLLEQKDIPDSGLKFTTISGIVNAPPEAVWELFQDANEFRRFLWLVSDSEELNRHGGKRQFRFVIQLDPFSSLVTGDITLVAEVEESIDYEQGTWRADYTSIQGSTVERAYGSWEIEEFGEGRSFVVFTVFIDMGLPATFDIAINTYTEILLKRWAEDLRRHATDRGVLAELKEKAAARAARRAIEKMRYEEPPRGSQLEDLIQ